MENNTGTQKIKECAKRYVNRLDLEMIPCGSDTSPNEYRITHPFWDSTKLPPYYREKLATLLKNIDQPVILEQAEEAMKAPDTIKENIKKTIEKCEVYHICTAVKSPYTVPFLQEVREYLSDDGFRLIVYAIMNDYISRYEQGFASPKQELLALFTEFRPEDFMPDDVYEEYRKLPDVLTVYRGMNEDNEHIPLTDAFRWTISEQTLIFRENYGIESQDGRVYEAKIRKEDVFHYDLDDHLLYVNPDKVFDIVFHEDFPLPEDAEDWEAY